MKPYTAHAIVHTDLSLDQHVDVPMGASFWVFWYKEWPLGHIWFAPENGPVAHDWAKATWPAVESSAPLFSFSDWLAQAELYFDPKHQEGQFWSARLAPLYQNAFAQISALPSLSVVICTRDRTPDLVLCLQALFCSQDLDFETIVVDNAPSDNSTATAVKDFPNVKYVCEPQKGLDNARNAGAKAASGQVVAFTDDDVRVHPLWTQRIKSAFDSPATMAVTGLVLPMALETLSAFVFEKHWGFNRGYHKKTFDQDYFEKHLPYGVPVWDMGAGANMAFRKMVFDLVGYFDPRLDVGASGCSGDSEFWYRILAEGWVCQYDPRAVVFHRHRETRADLKKQLNGYMRGQVSSLLVQYERWGHIGNLKRVFKYLPQYYWHRLGSWGKGEEHLLNLELGAELKGCLQGAWYYWQHRQKSSAHFPYPLQLHRPLTMSPTEMVTVVITNYNYGHFLQQCIDSVLQQTHPHVEIIVVDDGSNDGSEKVLLAYPQITVLYTQREGVAAARNAGAAAAKGRFLLFLDADDWLVPEALEVHLYHFQQNPSVAMVGGNHLVVDEQGQWLGRGKGINKAGWAYADLLEGNFWAMEGSILFRRNLFKAFRFNPARKRAEFYELNLTISRFFPILAHDRPVIHYRKHPHSKSASRWAMWEDIKNILDQQVPWLYSPQELQAHQQGLENWRKHYSDEPES